MLNRKRNILENREPTIKAEENEINITEHIDECINLNENDDLVSDVEKVHFCYYNLKESQKTKCNLSKIEHHFSNKNEIKLDQNENQKQSFISKKAIDQLKKNETNVDHKEELESILKSSIGKMEGQILFQSIDKETFDKTSKKYSISTKKSIGYCKHMIINRLMWKKNGNKWENMVTQDIKNKYEFKYSSKKKIQNCTVFFCD